MENKDNKCFLWSVLRYLHPIEKHETRLTDIQYCAKVMQTNFAEFRPLFSRSIADISPPFLIAFRRKFADISQTQTRFHRSFGSIWRKFALAKIRLSEMSATLRESLQ